jgi:hypothetical protein
MLYSPGLGTVSLVLTHVAGPPPNFGFSMYVDGPVLENFARPQIRNQYQREIVGAPGLSKRRESCSSFRDDLDLYSLDAARQAHPPNTGHTPDYQ